MKYFARVLGVAVLLALVAGHAFSQQRQQRQPRIGRNPQADQYEITSKISEAMRYLARDPGRSLSIMRRLNATFPSNERVLSRLGQVFQVMDKPDSAQVYLEQAMAINPSSLEAGKQLGMLYLAANRPKDATRLFDKLLAANKYNISAYRTVGTALRDMGRFDEALRVYADGRDRSERNFALTLEVAAMHQQLGNYTGALEEYLYYIGDQGRNYRATRRLILELMRDAGPAHRDELVAELDRRLERGQGNRFVMLDVLSGHYLERGLLEKSLEMALAADAERASDGSVLLALAEQILAEAEGLQRSERPRYLQMGVRALDAFTNGHPKSPGTDRAKYMLATIYVQFGSSVISGTRAERMDYLERAVNELAELSRRYPNSEYSDRAYLDRGDVLLYKLHRPDDALAVYKSGAVNSRRYADLFGARIAELYLGQKRNADAEHYLGSLINSGVPELIDTGIYYTGLRLAFTGDYEAARDTLTALAETEPASPYTNDAIETAWVIEEALQYESSSLTPFMEARRAAMAGDTTTVLLRLRDVVAKPVYETLRPRALFRLGVALQESGDYDGALDVLNRFLKEYPDDGLRPDVQRHIASIYEEGLEQFDKALHEYEAVLVDYPDYAFLDEVRKDVRRLRFIVEGEEYEQ